MILWRVLTVAIYRQAGIGACGKDTLMERSIYRLGLYRCLAVSEEIFGSKGGTV